MIRVAEIADIDDIVMLANIMHKEGRFNKFSFSVDKFYNIVSSAIDNDDYLVLVCENDDFIIGGFIGFVAEQFFSNELMAGDLGLFIHPKHRGGTMAAKIIKYFVKWAIDSGANPAAIQLGITTGVYLDKTSALYERLGFEHIGAIFNYKGVANV